MKKSSEETQNDIHSRIRAVERKYPGARLFAYQDNVFNPVSSTLVVVYPAEGQVPAATLIRDVVGADRLNPPLESMGGNTYLIDNLTPDTQFGSLIWLNPRLCFSSAGLLTLGGIVTLTHECDHAAEHTLALIGHRPDPSDDGQEVRNYLRDAIVRTFLKCFSEPINGRAVRTSVRKPKTKQKGARR